MLKCYTIGKFTTTPIPKIIFSSNCELVSRFTFLYLVKETLAPTLLLEARVRHGA